MKNKSKRIYLTSFEQPNTQGKLSYFPHDPLNNANVKKLRIYTRIEKLIKHKKSNLQKALAIAHFTSKAWRHDGFNSNPKKQDALTLLKLAAQGASFSCVQFASVFVQLCQCVGIPARVLQVRTRYPELGSSGHAHVTAEYFDNDLEKWVWVDPQIHAYATHRNIPVSQNELAELIVQGIKPKIHFSSRTMQYLGNDRKRLNQLETFIKRYTWSSKIGGINSFYTSQKKIKSVGCKRDGVLPAITMQGFATKSVQFISRTDFDAPLNICQMSFEAIAPKKEYQWKNLKDYKGFFSVDSGMQSVMNG